MLSLIRNCLLLAITASARDVEFAPFAGLERNQQSLRDDDGIDISTGSEFSGLTTFANLPYANCFTDDWNSEKEDAYDIAILGAPFDTAVTARPGARFGLARHTLLELVSHITHVDFRRNIDGKTTGRSFWNKARFSSDVSAIRVEHIYRYEGFISTPCHVARPTLLRVGALGENSFMSWAKILDCGDAPLTFLDNTIALKQLEKAHKIKERVGDTNVYVSVDIDVLDPAFAPATGTAEVGGWTTRELLSILDGLEGINIVGADVVEVAPVYDNPGETTVLAAAEVVHSLLTLMVQKPVKSRE
ncbi:agmatinase, partial [Lecanoromycetidae sp. Uapishka_2]